MDLYDTLTSVFNGLAHTTSEIDKSIHQKQSKLEDSFIDNFIHELNDFLYNSRDICRLKQMPENTIYEIDGEGDDYFVTMVDSKTPNLPKLNGYSDDIFYIPKNMCNLNIDESLYKVEDLIQEEVHYKNYLQLKDGIYTVVDKNGNILK